MIRLLSKETIDKIAAGEVIYGGDDLVFGSNAHLLRVRYKGFGKPGARDIGKARVVADEFCRLHLF